MRRDARGYESSLTLLTARQIALGDVLCTAPIYLLSDSFSSAVEGPGGRRVLLANHRDPAERFLDFGRVAPAHSGGSGSREVAPTSSYPKVDSFLALAGCLDIEKTGAASRGARCEVHRNLAYNLAEWRCAGRFQKVSWIRKRDLHILTSSIQAYTGDARFSVKHPEASDEWTLKIDYVQPRDAGVYECQVNTEPKMNLAFMLRVEAAQAKILGEEDVYVKKGSTISLTCTVNVHSAPPSSVSWHHGGAVVDFDSPRGGVSLETEKTESGTTSRLLVTQVRLTDSGNYTCIPSNANPASVMVHVLNGEHPAAMQHGGSCGVAPTILLASITLLVANLLRLERGEGGEGERKHSRGRAFPGARMARRASRRAAARRLPPSRDWEAPDPLRPLLGAHSPRKLRSSLDRRFDGSSIAPRSQARKASTGRPSCTLDVAADITDSIDVDRPSRSTRRIDSRVTLSVHTGKPLRQSSSREFVVQYNTGMRSSLDERFRRRRVGSGLDDSRGPQGNGPQGGRLTSLGRDFTAAANRVSRRALPSRATYRHYSGRTPGSDYAASIDFEASPIFERPIRATDTRARGIGRYGTS
ncbi:hypothetical protein KM043_000339 [Ampulex compressa]|nr:hypothetical protein KM043_000339 [Ampulex compressa]